mgnify:CR=1 FL=1
MQSICLTSSSSADGTVLSSGLRLLRVNSAAYSLSSLAQSVERTCGRRWQSPFAVDALAMSSAQRLRHRWMLVHQCVCVCVAGVVAGRMQPDHPQAYAVCVVAEEYDLPILIASSPCAALRVA